MVLQGVKRAMNKTSSKQISISETIYKALNKKRQQEFSTHKMTGYIEEILNLFVHDKLVRVTSLPKQ